MTPGETGFYRLTGGTAGPALDGLAEVDLREEDIVRFTNAGPDLGSALFILDLAAASEALSVLVFRNPYFVKQVQPSFCSAFSC